MDSDPNPSAVQRHRVLLVEDQTAIREMLAVLLHAWREFEIVGQAESIEEAKRLVAELRPDIVVLDWMFPEGTGAEFLARLRAEAQTTEVLVFSATTSPHAVREALTGGAKGFVEKGASVAELKRALQAVATGRVYFGPAVARTVDELLHGQTDSSTVLSEREREVLAMLATGLPSREIAARLGVSLKTVQNHRMNLAAKVGLHSVAELTMHAARMGLIPGPHDLGESAGTANSRPFQRAS